MLHSNLVLSWLYQFLDLALKSPMVVIKSDFLRHNFARCFQLRKHFKPSLRFARGPIKECEVTNFVTNIKFKFQAFIQMIDIRNHSFFLSFYNSYILEINSFCSRGRHRRVWYYRGGQDEPKCTQKCPNCHHQKDY